MKELAQRLEEQAAAFDKERQKTNRHTRIMICMMEFVRKMLRERLEKRESELQLEVVKIQGIQEETHTQLKTTQDEFEKYKTEKSREIEEFHNYKDDSAKKTN